jgi:hypothetical protein
MAYLAYTWRTRLHGSAIRDRPSLDQPESQDSEHPRQLDQG